MHANQWRDFLKNYQHRVYKRGQIILFQGESPRYAFLVNKGVVKTYNIDYDGKEQFIDLESLGSTFPKLWIWNKELSSTYYYEALTDAEVYLIPRDDFVRFITSDDQLIRDEMTKLLVDYRNTTTRLNALLYTRASDKIAHVLKYLADTYAPHGEKENITISIKLTHQHIASLTGLTRETVSVELSKFKNKGILKYKPSEYKINLSKLDQFLRKEF